MEIILQSVKKIDSKKQVIIYCQTGKRAAAVVYMLSKKYNFNNIFNLAGGYKAYVDLISNKS